MKPSADILASAGILLHDVAAAPDSSPVLLERRSVTGNLLRLKLSRPPGFAYRAGQHVKMGVPGLLRTYSLVSAPHEDHLEFFVELYPGGRLSERLRSLTPGATMALGGTAKGDLQLDAQRVNQFLIATVTGIAPCVSLLRDHRHRPAAPHRFVVLHGASHADEFGYAVELRGVAGEIRGAAAAANGLVYVPTVSRPDSPRNQGWQGARGRVESVAGELAERFRLGPTDTAVLVCGHPAMVRTLSTLFVKLGYRTRTEPFT